MRYRIDNGPAQRTGVTEWRGGDRYGGQQVAVTAKRDLKNLQMRYRIDNGPAQRTGVTEWRGGDRYGGQQNLYYADYRGTVTGAQPGDTVEVWFTGRKSGVGRLASERFDYEVASAEQTDGDVLILAAEDYTGATPAQAGGPNYVDEYEAALVATGHSTDVYDVDANGRSAPHPLGVLSHYDAVVWETGDDILPRHEGQPAGTAAKYALDLELAVRDYLNEGGKLLLSGKFALFAQGADGAYFYNPFEDAQGGCTQAGAYPCLALLNDFAQYWLGAYQYVDGGGHDADGNPFPLLGNPDTGFDGWTGMLNGGDSADNQDHSAAFVTTSSFLPPEEFPQFASSAPVIWERGGGNPYDPFTGEWYVFSQQADQSYKRLTHQADLIGASSGELTFQVSAATEADWDFMFVEARTVGQDDWTTLPDANGHTSQDTGSSCAAGWAEQIHPHLLHYVDADCAPTGSTGEWHAFSGNSNGWQEWSVDLSQFAGQQVEVSITYASDWAVQGIGVFLDDATISVDGAAVSETSFEQDLGGWQLTGPAEGSPPNANGWQRTMSAIEEGAVVTTDSTLYTGFGIEGLQSMGTADSRNQFVARAMDHLLG
ncbi:MAG: hypothetical protein GEU93_04870 [Propionibacteriales bacterium]|nr:hypothetical protein [Propionibacteriales bacterium]